MPRQNTRLAIIYDFDGTLAPGNMQEPQFIPDIGMSPKVFWAEVNHLCEINKSDKILMYMHLMLKKANEKGVKVDRKGFRDQGRRVAFFEGVEEWFDRINAYSESRNIINEHYIVSSGNAEIIEGTKIARHFKEIYASRFMFDQHEVAAWPAQAVNYTTKTQFLFRINKDVHELTDDKRINEFVEMKERPVPFENMIYIGDSANDIPCFRLVKDSGGLSIAVYEPRGKNALMEAKQFLKDNRVNCVVPADYQEGSDLDGVVKAQFDLVAARANVNRRLARRRTSRKDPKA